jgi:hypothetical protein
MEVSMDESLNSPKILPEQGQRIVFWRYPDCPFESATAVVGYITEWGQYQALDGALCTASDIRGWLYVSAEPFNTAR